MPIKIQLRKKPNIPNRRRRGKNGGDAHIVVQSMTNTKTQDVEASVKQCIQLAEAGCEIIRLTAQNLDARA
ncbi:MAG: flavodoxin-dependent (E)-4-hydroxy-3-methylbut-2-enyl-diphosphate synthase [Bacilli bacterium]